MAVQTYLVHFRDRRLALAVGAGLEDRLARDGRDVVALVPAGDGFGLARAGGGGRGGTRRSFAGAPQVVALYEDGLLARLESLGLTAYIGVGPGEEPGAIRWGNGGGAMLLPVTTAGDLVDAIARRTPWAPYAARMAKVASPSRRDGGLPGAVSPALSRKLAVAGIAGPLLLSRRARRRGRRCHPRLSQGRRHRHRARTPHVRDQTPGYVRSEHRPAEFPTRLPQPDRKRFPVLPAADGPEHHQQHPGHADSGKPDHAPRQRLHQRPAENERAVGPGRVLPADRQCWPDQRRLAGSGVSWFAGGGVSWFAGGGCAAVVRGTEREPARPESAGPAEFGFAEFHHLAGLHVGTGLHVGAGVYVGTGLHVGARVNVGARLHVPGLGHYLIWFGQCLGGRRDCLIWRGQFLCRRFLGRRQQQLTEVPGDGSGSPWGSRMRGSGVRALHEPLGFDAAEVRAGRPPGSGVPARDEDAERAGPAGPVVVGNGSAGGDGH